MKKELLEELNGYISSFKLNEIKNKYLTKYNNLNLMGKIKNFPFKIFLKKLEINNSEFIKKEKQKYAFLFNTVDGYSLDEEQREAIIKDPKNLLIVASAGSGKSLTLVGKILYLVNKGVLPSKILCISFTNESSNDLRKKLLKNNLNVDVKTFHKLGISILKQNGEKISIADENVLKSVLEERKKDFLFLLDFVTLDSKGNKIVTPSNIKNEFLDYSSLVLEYKQIVSLFISMFKCYGYKDFKQIYKKISKKDKRNFLIVRLCEKVYLEYEKKLKILKKYDFNDIILKSLSCREYKEYDYILVDEFQDSSKIRSLLLKRIQNKTGAKIVAVGDDWQSIYGFSGSSLDSFVNFEKYFPDSEIVFLKNTYRNSKEIITISSNFITKNNLQLKKDLNGFKTNLKPIKIFYYENDYIDALKKLLKKVKKDNILILARNNKEVLEMKKDIKNKIMTIHSSKGLEAENVIFVDTLNFPNKRKIDDVFKYIMKEEKYLYAEERRLFYVLLTRTKNNVYFLVKKEEMSTFVKEIIKENKKFIEVIS